MKELIRCSNPDCKDKEKVHRENNMYLVLGESLRGYKLICCDCFTKDSISLDDYKECGNPNCNSDEKLHKQENMNDAPYDINVRICDSCMEDC